MGSISNGVAESNTSQTASARRNNAAGVAAAKENVRLRPSLLRLASTEAALSPATVAGGDRISGGGSDAARVVFCAAGAAGISLACISLAIVSFTGASGIGVSGAGDI